MKAENDEGKALQQIFEHRDEKGIADALAGGDALVLGVTSATL